MGSEFLDSIRSQLNPEVSQRLSDEDLTREILMRRPDLAPKIVPMNDQGQVVPQIPAQPGLVLGALEATRDRLAPLEQKYEDWSAGPRDVIAKAVEPRGSQGILGSTVSNMILPPTGPQALLALAGLKLGGLFNRAGQNVSSAVANAANAPRILKFLTGLAPGLVGETAGLGALGAGGAYLTGQDPVSGGSSAALQGLLQALTRGAYGKIQANRTANAPAPVGTPTPQELEYWKTLSEQARAQGEASTAEKMATLKDAVDRMVQGTKASQSAYRASGESADRAAASQATLQSNVTQGAQQALTKIQARTKSVAAREADIEQGGIKAEVANREAAVQEAETAAQAQAAAEAARAEEAGRQGIYDQVGQAFKQPVEDPRGVARMMIDPAGQAHMSGTYQAGLNEVQAKGPAAFQVPDFQDPNVVRTMDAPATFQLLRRLGLQAVGDDPGADVAGVHYRLLKDVIKQQLAGTEAGALYSQVDKAYATQAAFRVLGQKLPNMFKGGEIANPAEVYDALYKGPIVKLIGDRLGQDALDAARDALRIPLAARLKQGRAAAK